VRGQLPVGYPGEVDPDRLVLRVVMAVGGQHPEVVVHGADDTAARAGERGGQAADAAEKFQDSHVGKSSADGEKREGSWLPLVSTKLWRRRHVRIDNFRYGLNLI